MNKKIISIENTGLTKENTQEPIIVEQLFNASVKEVWSAITSLTEMKQWYFEQIESFKPLVGFETSFALENQGRIFIHLWKITKVEPLKKITYNWKYEGYKGDSILEMQLLSKNNQTKLVVTHTITENFQANIPEFSRESCLGGWHYFIKESLKNHLGNK